MTRWLGLAVLALAVLAVSVDATALALAVPYLAADLHPSGTWLLWIGDAYSFTAGALLITMGALADRVGRRRLFLLGSVAFGVFSVLAAYAPSAPILVLARVLLGVSGAAILPSTLAIILQLFAEPRQRVTALGVWAATAAVGEAAGPLIGGALLEHAWWGSVFLVGVPAMAAVVVLGLRVLPESTDRDARPPDIASLALALAGIAATMYAVKGVAAYGWRTVLAPVALAGVLALAGFVRRQLRVANPLVDVRMFVGRAFGVAIVSNLLATLCLVGVLFYMAQYLLLVRGYSPLATGLRELPATLGAGSAALLAGILTRRWSVATLTRVGLLIGGSGLALLAPFPLGHGYLLLGAALLAVGAGTGLVYTVAAELALASAPPARAGAASGLSETAYELGAALGIALLGTVVTFAYRIGFNVPAGLTTSAANTARDSLAGATSAAATLPAPLSERLLETAQSAFVGGLRVATASAAALLICAALVARALLRAPRVQRDQDVTVKRSIVDVIGDTPLVELTRLVVAAGVTGRLIAKLEYLNPGFSKKDRIALELIQEARAAGVLIEGQPVVELTSGNTGTGLALVCGSLGHPFVAIMSRGNTVERARMMRALGARVVLVDQAPGSQPGHVSGADLALVEARTQQLCAELGAFRADQFTLQANVLAHLRHTGPEIWEQSGGSIDVFVDFVGTGGSFTGVGRHLRERNASVRCYVVEPATVPVLAGESVTNPSHQIQGGGYGIADLPLLDRDLVTGYLRVTDDEAVAAARMLAKEEGIFAGFSAGANLAAALQLLRDCERGATVAFLVADSGLKYLSTDLYPTQV